MSGADTLVLEEIVDDLVRVVQSVEAQYDRTGKVSYQSVQREVSADLSLHLLNYLRFLEGEGLLTYDRITDEIRITDEGRAMAVNPDTIREAARVTFSDHLGPDDGSAMDEEAELEVEGAFSRMFDDMPAEMDSSIGSAGPWDGEDEAEGRGIGGVSMKESGESGSPSSFASEGSGREVSGSVDTPEGTGESTTGSEQESARGELATTPATSSSAKGAVAPRQAGKGMQEDRFERLEELGSGGIGTVYKGRQVSLNREVALKEVREVFSVFAGVQRQDILTRFQSIMQTQARLLHPNIIQVIEVDISGEFPYAVMQFAPNGNLRRLIEHGERPPLAVALKYFLQILHALNTAHDQGVVHGSIKPENVVLDSAGNAMLTDFGISKIVERDGGRGNQVYVGVGTVAYMSPEQFQDPNLATVKSDIYSLGIMFYEMLTGKVPGRRSPMPSSFYPDIPRALDDIFDKMSIDSLEDRYDTIEEIIEDVYAAEEVLSILDKRAGVLFLRDPMMYGEVGVGEGVTLGSPVPVWEELVVRDKEEREGGESHEAEMHAEEVSEVSEVEEVDFGEVPAVALSDEGIDSMASEVDEFDEGEGGLLDKLDKYGQLFEGD